ncbi:hypothetical protein, partial [Flammeovirga sp. EKP202]|uniref:hypothetical protein n=1 Tax=Flammeovirga sp. EKP202 TaxID=2770592 RepID=UPI0019BB909B
NYSPQNKIGKSQIIEHSGNPIVISLPADINSSNNSYQWYKDGKVIENDANQNTYTTDQMGTFHCEITNVTLPELTLVSEPTYILNSTIFEQDSLGTVAIYNKNNNNTLQWDINAPITTWQGVQFSNGRINQLKINNAKLDTLPNSIGTLDALDTLWIQNNDLTFQSLDNIATPLPLNFIYQPQNMVGEEKFMDATNGKDVLLEVPSDFDIETTDNHFQWYKDNEIIADANNRQYTTNTTGEYFCQITNDNFPLLTLQTASFNVFDTNQLKADSIIVASIYNDNPSNTLNW